MPTPEEFQRLVAEEAAKEKANQDQLAATIERRKKWWPAQVKELLDRIEGWLGPLIKDGSLTFERREVIGEEELLGHYVVLAARIRLASKEMNIEPGATMIFGGFGRVDVSAPNGRATWLLLGETPEKAAWHVAHPIAAGPVAPRPLSPPSTGLRKATFVPLTQEIFQQLFVDLFGIGGR